MILIVGSTYDDVMYFESKLRNKSEETILGQYKLMVGTIFSQQVGVIYGGYTNYLSAMIVGTILAKRNSVVLVINVGKCTTCVDDIKPGEIAISKQAYLAEVNQIGIENAILGQVPTCPQSYVTDTYVLHLMVESINKILKKSSSKIATYISIEKTVHSKKDLEGISSAGGVIFGNKNDIVVDSCTGGVAIASYLNKVPFISVEVVGGKIDENRTVSQYVEVLKRYSDLGKAVTSFIGEISRNEVISGNRDQQRSPLKEKYIAYLFL